MKWKEQPVTDSAVPPGMEQQVVIIEALKC